jgi:hypothetical protein
MPTLVETQVRGILLEELDADFSTLTIDLEAVIPADSLAKLLRGLAAFYSIGVSLDNPRFEAWFEVKDGWVPSTQLLISELIVGTPNRLKVAGRRRLIATLAAIMGALAQISGNMVELKKGSAEPTRVEVNLNVNQGARPQPPPPPPPAPPQPTLGELMDAIQRENSLLSQLDAQYNEGKISLSDYVIRRDMLESALRDLKQSLHIVCAASRPA